MASTQDFLQIEKIKEGIIILKNKGLRSTLMISSLNFALKSAEEQNAILYQFQNFLNSLDFPCQILGVSRKLNITGYLEKLDEIKAKESNELLKTQIGEYRNFVDEILREGSIMQKSFYISVPFSLMETQSSGTPVNTAAFSEMTEDLFQRAKNQLMQRVEFVMMGLKSCGLEAVPLNTLEIAELLWALYHPIEAEKGFYPEFPPELLE